MTISRSTLKIEIIRVSIFRSSRSGNDSRQFATAEYKRGVFGRGGRGCRAIAKGQIRIYAFSQIVVDVSFHRRQDFMERGGVGGDNG